VRTLAQTLTRILPYTWSNRRAQTARTPSLTWSFASARHSKAHLMLAIAGKSIEMTVEAIRLEGSQNRTLSVLHPKSRWVKIRSPPCKHRRLRYIINLYRISSWEQRNKLKQGWQITVQFPVTQHAGIKIVRTPKYIDMSAPKRIEALLVSQGMENCNPATTPTIDSQDMATRRADEPRATMQE
jgi:hypothetical protein